MGFKQYLKEQELMTEGKKVDPSIFNQIKDDKQVQKMIKKQYYKLENKIGNMARSEHEQDITLYIANKYKLKVPQASDIVFKLTPTKK